VTTIWTVTAFSIPVPSRELISITGFWKTTPSPRGGLDFGAKANGEDQMTYTIVGWAGNDAQKGNASYYWNSKDADGNTYFPYLAHSVERTHV